jgi:acetoin utilization deacetylase AcuC-like enzyme
MSIAIHHLWKTTKIKKVFILDFDLHCGDGNINCLEGDRDVTIFNPDFPGGNEAYINAVEEELKSAGKFDIIAASAGFDQYVHDWGGLLTTDDFHTLGSMMREFADQRCQGRRFAILEGGYNHQDLGKNIRAFLEGLESQKG